MYYSFGIIIQFFKIKKKFFFGNLEKQAISKQCKQKVLARQNIMQLQK